LFIRIFPAKASPLAKEFYLPAEVGDKKCFERMGVFEKSIMLPTKNMTLPDWSPRLVDELADRHVSIIEHALPDAMIASLRESFASRTFRPARVGPPGLASERPALRNDEISWIEETDLRGEAERDLFSFLEGLRLELNRTLYLGLTDFEAHYARYDKGHFYAKHVDRFQSDGARTISVVIYLNEAWTPGDGGALRLHLSPSVDVLPKAGTLVCFTSDDIEHEVRPSNRPRMSIAIWFRRDWQKNS
jgi:SM-20-related protein